MSIRILRMVSLLVLTPCALSSSGCAYGSVAFKMMTAPKAAPIDPGVRTDQLASLPQPFTFTRRAFPDFGPAGAIAGTRCAQVDPGQLLIASRSQAVILEDGEIQQTIEFEETVGELSIVDVDGDGTCEFVDHGGGWQDTSLLSADGTVRWTHERFMTRKPSIDIMRHAQLDDDPSTMEFLVGYNGSGGVAALDMHGKELWHHKAGNVFSVETVDLNGDGTLEVIHSNSRGRIVARKLDGSFLGTLKHFHPGDFFILKSEGRVPRVVQHRWEEEQGYFEVRKLSGQLETELSLSEVGHGYGNVLLFQPPTGDPFYVMTRTLRAVGARSQLAIYSLDGTVLYDEVLPSSYISAHIVEWESGQTTVVVGIFNELMILELANDANDVPPIL